MTTDVAHVPSETLTTKAPVVLTLATSVTAGRRALDHAVHLFGSTHRHVVAAVHATEHEFAAAADLVGAVVGGTSIQCESLITQGDCSRAICDAAHRLNAVAVVVGLDVGENDRTGPSLAFHLVRRAPCPVILVAVEGT